MTLRADSNSMIIATPADGKWRDLGGTALLMYPVYARTNGRSAGSGLRIT
jgi:hypothetical protein